MIAVGADSQEPQLESSLAGFQVPMGDELPSLSCDLGDISLSNDIDQLLLQNFGDFVLPSDSRMQLVFDPPEEANFPPQPVCDLTSFLFEHTPRPRDLNLIFPEENVAPLADTLAGPSFPVNQFSVTPTYSGGITPVNLSRATSPAWSESSGSMSETAKDIMAGRNSNPVPRHKRPSHKRAEIKRRDKIKTCLDDMKDHVPSLQAKGKLSESTTLTKAAEYIHHLKDGHTERGSKVAELRREIECLSTEIHNFQENLPASGLKEEVYTSPTLDDLYYDWAAAESQRSTKFFIFSSVTSRLFQTFKEVVGPATSMNSLVAKAQEWQSKFLALPVLRKQILSGMLDLSRQNSIVVCNDKLNLQFGSSTDNLKDECSAS